MADQTKKINFKVSVPDSQRPPVYPGRQMHSALAPLSEHDPLFKHGLISQLLIPKLTRQNLFNIYNFILKYNLITIVHSRMTNMNLD